MDDLEFSRRSLFAAVFGCVALAVGTSAAKTHGTGIEHSARNVPAGTVSYTFDDEGRLLSVAHDGVTRNAAVASFA